MKRRRMYLFERGWVDFLGRLRRFFSRLGDTCGDLWAWFWEPDGPGARLFEVLLRLAVVAVAVVLCVLYYRYQKAHQTTDPATFGAMWVIFIVASLILWGWKAPVHVAARAASGASSVAVILVGSLAATALVMAVFSVYFAALVALTALSVLVFVPMRIAHGLWMLHRKITYECPWDNCSYAGLPIHICSCGTEYADLVPSFYGIFYHVCRHDGQQVKLPTLDLFGRNRLHRICGSCRRELRVTGLGELPVRPIMIVGGTASGKSVYLRQVTRLLREHFGAMPRAKVQAGSAEQAAQLARDLGLLDRGQVLAKTVGDAIQAFSLAVRVPKRFLGLLYAYDAPGEHFETMHFFSQKQPLQHAQGLLLLIDPFSLPPLEDYARRHLGDLQPSQTPLPQVVATLINGVNAMVVERTTDQCRIPLAVVIGKADALPLRDFPSLSDLCPGPGRSSDGSLSQRCRAALEQLTGDNTVLALERKFAQVRYFACSPLGRMPEQGNSQPFQPVGVLEPFLWLLEANGSARSKAR